MTRQSIIEAAVSMFVGVGTMMLVAQTFPYTSAIASPPGFFEWFRANLTLEVGLLAFGLMVSAPAVVIAMGLATFALCWQTRLPKYLVATWVVVGAVTALLIGLPIYYGDPLFFGFTWWSASTLYAAVLTPFVCAWIWRKRHAVGVAAT